MIKFRNVLAIGAALIAAPALAQDAPAPAAKPAAPAAAAAITDAEVKSFAKAAIAVDKVNKDAGVPAADKGKKLAEVVTTAGLKPERFNEIANASGADTALQKRIQDAIVAEQGTAPAPAK
ncbi:DUF4168 domain-containing protein [Sphingomonas sp. MG17]|uniref:DUF4168 domain-containing protein n=2 Tax=Sphingomonas tagetis TaxID=2949092 RepID=A0A9X2HF33_9SPHN|nr:DUF4168 domain-containing protein [Sphingomonas tagetis]